MGRHNNDRELIWIRLNKNGLNLAEIARHVGLNKVSFNQWVKGEKDKKGTEVKLTDERKRLLNEWIIQHCSYSEL